MGHEEFHSVEGFRRMLAGRFADVTVTSSESSLSGYGLDADNCEHCHAAYGHRIMCPILNRNVAEAQSAFLSDADKLRLRALGVRW